MQDIKALVGFIRNHRDDMPKEVRLSAEIAVLTLHTMQSPSFHQSEGLKLMAARHLSDFEQKYRAWKARELVTDH